MLAGGKKTVGARILKIRLLECNEPEDNENQQMKDASLSTLADAIVKKEEPNVKMKENIPASSIVPVKKEEPDTK
ncbi:hypothetical protein diail_8795, partial [Diaporthe ilicicola]